MRRLMLCFAVAAWTIASRAEDAVPRADPGSPAVSVQGYGRHDGGCAAWTDACVICLSGAQGRVSCSTPGIACEPEAIRCTAVKDAPAPP